MCFPTFTWALGRTNEIHATLQLGSVSETVNVMAEATTVQASSAMVSSALSKQAANAKGKGVGEMFEYSVKTENYHRQEPVRAGANPAVPHHASDAGGLPPRSRSKKRGEQPGDTTQIEQQEVEAITKDQARLLGNMKTLKGGAEEKALLQRDTRQLDSQQDRLNRLNKEISDVQEKRIQEQEKLDRMVQEITMDQNL
jgi:hypothetical protein